MAATATETTNATQPLVAADLLKANGETFVVNASHPLGNAFTVFLSGAEATKRQARKFLAANPAYRQARPA